MSSMTPTDLQICNDVLSGLTSPSHRRKNYLFLEPVDTKLFPTYTTIVQRPMDLGTLKQHLDNGLYTTRDEFYKDAALCFQNAETFHKDKPENAWVIKLGKDMLKILNKEKRKAEKKYLGTTAAAANAKGSPASTSSASGTSAGTTGTTTTIKKPVLKLKLGGSKKDKNESSSSSSTTKTPKSTTIKTPKLKLQLKPPTSASTTTSTDANEKKRKASPIPSTPPVSSKKISIKFKKDPLPKNDATSTNTTTDTTTAPTTTSKSTKVSKKAQEKTAKKPTAHKVSKPTKLKTPKLTLKLGKAKVLSSSTSPANSRSSTPVPTPTPTLTLKISTGKPSAKDTKGKDAKSKDTKAKDAKGKDVKSKDTKAKEAKSKDTKAKTEKIVVEPVGPRGKELPTSVAREKAKKEEEAAANKEKATTPNSTTTKGKKGAKKEKTTKTSQKKATAGTKAQAKTPSATTTTKKSPASKLGLRLPLNNKSSKTPPSSAPKPPTTTKQTSTSVSKKDDKASRGGAMTPTLKAQCFKVLSALKRRERENASWFLTPVNDPRLIEDYKAKIPIPSDLGTISNKLEKNQYPTVADFVHDVRRVFSNCLRYNAQANDEYREIAGELVGKSEDYMHLFIYTSKEAGGAPLYPRLLYCWKSCLEILDKFLELKNPDDGLATVYFFAHPVSYFCGGSLPNDYSSFVKTPMDLGTVTTKLFEGEYQNVEDFIADCYLVPQNCKAFHANRPDGAKLCEQASRLEALMVQLLEKLKADHNSYKGKEAQKLYLNQPPLVLMRPPKDFMRFMLQELRNTTYTDKFTKLSEPATRQFEDPVDMNVWKDYHIYVPYPMNLKLVDKNIDMDNYDTPESFEYDVNCIFSNCVAYNVPKRNEHIVNVAKYCAKIFRKMYSSRMKAFEASGGKVLTGEVQDQGKKPATQEKKEEPPVKKIKLEPVGAVKRPSGKGARKSLTIKINQNDISGGGPKSKSPKSPKPKPDAVAIDAPIDVNAAIAKIMKEYPNKRAFKDLQTWENLCSRFFRELKRHSWIGGNTFIFNAPVTLIHPEIKEGYNSKIKNPMDLTTCECKLLQGGFYSSAQDFVNDIALVFANAVTFNKAGKEQGDPLSCNYYDASQHLLRYSRWLSLEHLLPFLVDDSVNEGAKQMGPLTKWTLSTSNRADAISEMESIVFDYELDKNDVGDRYTWMETECEKLLKALRHQSDARHMVFFLQPSFPPDYCAYISKPIAWQQINQNLQDRKYNTIRQVVDDLRLIFTNALKYNEKLKAIDPVSGQAYDSAILMAKKLEVAIVRMLITVSDRIEREKIDQIILDREIEATEREEQETLKTAWKKERDKSTTVIAPQPKVVETIKIVQKKPAPRRNIYFDDEPTHERTDVEASRQQVLIYQRQQRERRDRAEMQKASKSLGLLVYANMVERCRAMSWAKNQYEKILSLSNSREVAKETTATSAKDKSLSQPSSVASKLNEKRPLVSVNIRKKSKKKKRRLMFE